MGDLIRLKDYRYPWREVITVDGNASTLQVYKNTQSGEVDVVQMNDDGETIRTVLTPADAELLHEALGSSRSNTG